MVLSTSSRHSVSGSGPPATSPTGRRKLVGGGEGAFFILDNMKSSFCPFAFDSLVYRPRKGKPTGYSRRLKCLPLTLANCGERLDPCNLPSGISDHRWVGKWGPSSLVRCAIDTSSAMSKRTSSAFIVARRAGSRPHPGAIPGSSNIELVCPHKVDTDERYSSKGSELDAVYN